MTNAIAAEHPTRVAWKGPDGLIGGGKHIVYIANDHEYRGEETLPALARIMAKHYGFTCTFVTGIDPETGFVMPGDGQVTGLDVLDDADLLVLAIRFQQWDNEVMAHFDAYLRAGKPVIGLRTSSHGFRINDQSSPYAKYSNGYKGEDYPYGFGEQVLGEHWVGHYGKNHKESSLLVIEEANRDHVVLKGITGPPHQVCGTYKSEVTAEDGNTILMRGHVLNGMAADSPFSEEKTERYPVAWLRRYAPEPEAAPFPHGRVFTTLAGCSEDILDDNFRRLLINAHLWCLQLEDHIRVDNPIHFVGPYHPSRFGRTFSRQQVKPTDIAGFDAPIYDPNKPVGSAQKKKKGTVK
jgi:hypothetical protein